MSYVYAHHHTGADLATRRHDHGLTRRELAQLAGVCGTTVAKVETGELGVGSPSHLAVLAALDRLDEQVGT